MSSQKSTSSKTPNGSTKRHSNSLTTPCNVEPKQIKSSLSANPIENYFAPARSLHKVPSSVDPFNAPATESSLFDSSFDDSSSSHSIGLQFVIFRAPLKI